MELFKTDGKKALIIEDSPTQAQLISMTLAGEDLTIFVAKTGLEGLEQCVAIQPDIVILDIILPDIDGFTVCRRLKQKMREYIPILILTARDKIEDRVDGLELGADDYISKSVGKREFVARVKSLLRIKSLHDKLQAMLEKERQSMKILQKVALVDHLTGVYNRHYMAEILTAEFERARRYNNPLSCIMVDVDYFKEFNSRYGHEVGDMVLKGVADTLKENVRLADTVARYGGDEFLILLPMTSEEDAAFLAERLCSAVTGKEWFHNDECLKVSISLGVASTRESASWEIKELLDHADKALYAGKESGRNKACRYANMGQEKIFQ